MAQPAAKKPANREKTYHVTKSELPLSCPGKDMLSWNSHPRVYLEMEKEGKAVCPYCGAIYILDED